MVKARGPAAARAPRAPAPDAGPVRKPRRKRRVWRNKAREAGGAPGNDPGVVAVRPPKAPEDFSPNWKALQELLKQRSQTPQEPPLLSQTDSKKQPQRVQQSRNSISDKAKRDAMGTENTDPEVTGASGPSGSLNGRKIQAQPKEKGAEKRTSGDVSRQQGDIKHKKRKAEEPTAPLPPALPTKDDIWFDDVDPADIEAAIGPEAASIARRQPGQSESSTTLVKEQPFGGLTKALAMDCEMVGVGPKGEESIVARVSLVNQHGWCVYDKHVKPTQPVTDYRTAVSGVRPADLAQGEEFEVVQREVADLLKGRILVGHALHNDLKALFLGHPKKKTRDTQKYKPFRTQVKSGRPSLKLLAERILGIQVQQAEHCSVQDAQVAMRLYVLVKRDWESLASDRRPPAPEARSQDA